MDRDISLIIVTFNSSGVIEPLLKSVFFSKTSVSGESFTLEVILIDNSSSDNTVEIVQEKFPSVKCEVRPNRGFGAGINTGAVLATGRLLICMNPDLLFDEDTLSEFWKSFQTMSHLSVMSPLLLNQNREPQRSYASRKPSLGAELFEMSIIGNLWRSNPLTRKYRMMGRVPQEIEEVEILCGACLAIPRVIFEKLGGYDESYFLYFEDADLSMRCSGEGIQCLLLPHIKLVHRHGDSTEKVMHRSVLEFYRSENIFFIKYLGKPKAFILRLYRRIDALVKLSIQTILLPFNFQYWLPRWRNNAKILMGVPWY